MAGGCCQRKSVRDGNMDGLDRRKRPYVDPVVVERAVHGQPIGRAVNTAEMTAIIVTFSQKRRLGPAEISEATGMSRSQVNLILARERARQGRRRT